MRLASRKWPASVPAEFFADFSIAVQIVSTVFTIDGRLLESEGTGPGNQGMGCSGSGKADTPICKYRTKFIAHDQAWLKIYQEREKFFLTRSGLFHNNERQI
jgi:hypothetical protein